MANPLVGIVLGSKSDLGVVSKAFAQLEELEIPYEARILSAHRTPHEAVEYAHGASRRGLKVLIGAAGRAAHLPGVLASHTVLPVIGIPVGGGPLSGVDALYSIVQMPSGVPVACVAIDGAQNAALLAAQIIATSDAALAERLAKWRHERARQALKDDAELQQNGWRAN